LLTFCSRSPIGRMKVRPGWRVCGRTRPNRKTMPSSNCCTCFTLRPNMIKPPAATNATKAIKPSIADTFFIQLVPDQDLSAVFRNQRSHRSQPCVNGWVTHRPRSGPILLTDSLVHVSVRDTDWDGVRLHVVTGKGGTGKTTVAAALALALASAGRKILLIEVEGRQGLARLFDRPPLPYEERKIDIGPGEAHDGRDPGGDVYALAIDPEGALLDYLQMFYGMRSAGVALTRLGMVDFATTIAPGLSDVLVTGKATEATRRKQSGSPSGFAYDAVVLDAPPTGRI